jgi:hypothetical protein
MSERRSSEGSESVRTVSRRQVLGATVVAAAGTGGLVASTAPARARTVDFGDVAVGSARTRGTTTENPVSRPLEVTDLTIVGPDAEEFTVVGGDAPFDLSSNGSHMVRIRFAPTSAGEKSARVQVDTARRSSLVAGRLTGTGVKKGAASASGEEDTPSETESNDDSSSNGSASSSAETDDSADSASAGEPSNDDSSGSPATEQPAASDSAEDSASTNRSTAPSTAASSSETSSASGDTTSESTSSASETGVSSTPSSSTENISRASDRSGALLTGVLDVNDDGSVSLQDFLVVIRRLGLSLG